MPFQTSTATDHHDLVDQLSDFATSEGAVIGGLGAVVAAGGSGYAIGDDLTLLDGKFKRAAVYNIDSEGASAAVLAAGGTGYPNGAQTFTLAGGTFTTACTVDCTVSGGIIQSIDAINNPGDYTVTPGNPVTISGGGGDATATMTWGAAATVSVIDHGVYFQDGGGTQPANPASTTVVPAGGSGATLTVTYSPDVVNGGTGGTYVIGDILTVSGGTSTSATTLEVLTVSAGQVLTAKVIEHGGYTVEPSNPVSVTGGGGTGATFDLNYDTNGWTLKRNNVEAVSATIGAGGSSYIAGDKITIVGGIDVKIAVIFNVDAVDGGGAVTGVTVEPTDGDYGEVPANPAATTGGTGTGATLNVTYTRVTGTSKGRDLILEGDASDLPTIGIRSYTDSISTADALELRGMTGYSAANDWESQPDICDGDNTVFEQGQYVPLDLATITYWFTLDGFAIRGIFKMSTTYTNMYLGFLDRLAIATKYPYPMLVLGCSSTAQRLFASGVIGYRGMVDPIAAAVGHQGPGRVRDPGGTWKAVKNSDDTGSGRNRSQDVIIWPAGQTNPLDALLQDRGSTNAFEFDDIIPSTGNPGSPAFNIIQIADSPENRSPMFLPVVAESDPVLQVLGSMRGVRWLSAEASPSNLQSEDTTEEANGDVFIVFQNCNQTDQWTFFAIKRE